MNVRHINTAQQTNQANTAASPSSKGNRMDQGHDSPPNTIKPVDATPDATDAAPATAPDSASAPATASQWYYALSAQPTGPVSLETLEAAIRAGTVKHGTLVWTPGMSEWAGAASISALRELFPATTPDGLTPERDAAFLHTPPVSRVPSRPPTTPGAITDPRDQPHSVGARMLLPVGRSGYAIVSGYCGLLSLFPLLGVLPALIGVITGLIALRHIRQRTNLHGKGRAWFGIVAGSLSIALHLVALLTQIW